VRARPERPCTRCGKVGRRRGDACHECEKPSPDVLDDALGAWVVDPRRCIQVWQEAG